MDVDGHYLTLGPWTGDPVPLVDTFVKETLLHSSVVTHVFSCRVARNKPHVGLTSTSLNDEADQFLVPPEADSQLDVFDDDDDLFMSPTNTGSTEEPVYDDVAVLVKITSIMVDGREFALNAAVRLACVIPDPSGEDSLWLSLRLGFILLVRMFHKGHYKPFVLQWWDIRSGTGFDTMGHHLCAHPAGLAAVAGAARGVFRIHTCDQTAAGVALLPHVNIPVDGDLLHCCFLNSKDHVSLLTVQLSAFHRLELHLFSWLGGYDSLDRCMLPLPNTFTMPAFVVPLSDAFLFVAPGELVLITTHHITSAVFDFTHSAFTGGFPTNYAFDGDDLYISTDAGAIYHVDTDSLDTRCVGRINDPILVFSIAKEGKLYRLVFGSDTGSNREVLLEPFDDSQKYSTVSLVYDYKNWAPVLDVQVIDAYPHSHFTNVSSNELWALTGAGKRTRLSQLRRGYSATRKTKSYERLRRANRIWPVRLHDKDFVVCSMPFETAVLELEGELVEIDDPAISTASSLLVHQLSDALLQITALEVIVTDLYEQTVLFTKTIVAAAASENTFAIVTEQGGSLLLGHYHNQELVGEVEIPSTVSVIRYVGKYLVAGDFEGNLHVYEGTHLTQTISLHNVCPYKDTQLVISDVVLHKNSLFVGTQDGYYVQFSYNDGFVLALDKFLRIANTDVTFFPHTVLYVLARNLWVVDDYPVKVYLSERTDRAIMAFAPLGRDFVFARDEGLAIGTMQSLPGPVIKQLNIGEGVKKLLYMEHLGTFVLLCHTRDAFFRLRFVDRKGFRVCSQEDTEIFHPDEFPQCARLWSVVRGDRISRKLLLGCSIGSRGSFKVLNITKHLQHGNIHIKAAELTSFDHREPITNIQQLDQTILFSSGNKIYATSYDQDAKKFSPVATAKELSSDIVLMGEGDNGALLVSTRSDSVLVFTLHNGSLQVVVKDPSPKSLVNSSQIGNAIASSDKLHSALSVMDTQNPFLTNQFTHQLSSIPRVYASNFTSVWTQHQYRGFLCVGVSGQVVFVRPSSLESSEIMAINKHIGSIPQLVERLNRPFANKITGKGMRPLYHPFFNYEESSSVVDYDMEELACFRTHNLSL